MTGAADDLQACVRDASGQAPAVRDYQEGCPRIFQLRNQIGLATTHVREIYDEGYLAKRLEVGAVVGAVKADKVRRESPVPGDVVLLLGGRTGRDGIGGATGSPRSILKSRSRPAEVKFRRAMPRRRENFRGCSAVRK